MDIYNGTVPDASLCGLSGLVEKIYEDDHIEVDVLHVAHGDRYLICDKATDEVLIEIRFQKGRVGPTDVACLAILAHRCKTETDPHPFTQKAKLDIQSALANLEKRIAHGTDNG